MTGFLVYMHDLYPNDVLNSLVLEAETIYAPEQDDLPSIKEEIDYRKITKEITQTMIACTIDIPCILIVPKGTTTISYKNFPLQCGVINFQPVSRDLLVQHLKTGDQETLSAVKGIASEERLEDYLIRSLIDFEDISYDEQSDFLYNLCAQLITHLKSYLKNEEEIRNVVLFYQKQLADFIHAQMLEHQVERDTDFEVKISKGFTALKEIAFTAEEDEKPINFRRSDVDKSKISKMIYNGFSKCLYPVVKFDSDTERRFAVILEQESLKWFKPARGQFQIYYQMRNETLEYVPDFAAETSGFIYWIS